MRVTREPAGDPEAARKRAAVELIAREEAALRRTARRFSLCAEDAEDAYQRALEIVLTKAPTDDPRELIRWTQVVTKHEALAIRKQRERILNAPPASADGESELDWVELIPARGDGPDIRAERRERVARSREALQALKPAELRALTLLAEGYSYAEISEMTGYSRTKVNRCLAEGRERFRRLVSGSEDGSRCREMLPLLSAFADGEAVDEDAVREHLRACAACRATLRQYRAAAGAAAALAPTLPARGLLDRLQGLLDGIHSRLPGGGAADPAVSGVAAGGTAAGTGAGAALGGAGGAGLGAAAKALIVCAGTVGGAAACVAGGVVPAPPPPVGDREAKPARIERVAKAAFATSEAMPEPAPRASEPRPSDPEPRREPEPPPPEPQPEATPAAAAPPPVEAGAVEYAPPPEPAPPPPAQPSSQGSGTAAGEFGP